MYQFLDTFEKKFCNAKDKDFRTFHFFIENCRSIDDRIEIRIDSKCTEEIGLWILDYFRDRIFTDYPEMEINEKLRILAIRFLEYKPELDDYGDGWWIAEKIFEYCSRAAVYIKTKDPKNLFRESKFVHCILNELGYDSLKESTFHNTQSHQMLAKYIREKVENIERRVSNIEGDHQL